VTPRRGAELAALAAGLALWAYVGWDLALWDARLQVVLHLLAAAALGAVAVYGLRGGLLPRTRMDVPVLVLLLAVAVACLSAANPGLSARALGASVATAAMLPVALLALRHRPVQAALVVAIPVVAVAAGTLAVLGWRRIEWLIVGAPGLPPVRLAGEATPFGSVAVPPFVLLALLPLLLLVEPPRLRRWLMAAVAVVGVPLTLISGSRSAWLAMAVAGLVLVVPALRGTRLPRMRNVRGLALAVIGVTVVAAGALFIAPRLTDLASLVYRAFLWRDTLLAVQADPVFGIGPGAMAWARQAAAPPLSFPVLQPHSHNVPLGLFGDAGAVGLAAGLALAAWFVRIAGPWHTRTPAGRAAFAVLAGFGVSMLFEDLTFLPNVNLLLVLLAAVALADARAVSWHRLSQGPLRLAVAGVAAVAVGAVMVLGDAAAVAYRTGVHAASAGQWEAGRNWLMAATTLDPWHPAGPKSLAVAAEWAGQDAEARSAATRAVALNAGDGQSWANLARLCARSGDGPCARAAAGQAVSVTTISGREAVNAALVYRSLGVPDDADRAYAISLLVNVRTALSTDWDGSPDAEAAAAELGEAPPELSLLVARRATGVEIEPNAYQSAAVRALAYAMLGRWTDADAAIAEAKDGAPGSPTTWALASVLAWHRGGDPESLLRIHDVVLGRRLPRPDDPPSESLPLSERPHRTRDIAAFREYPVDGLISDAERLVPDPPWPWALAELLPAAP
jgi:hypothetical protein